MDLEKETTVNSWLKTNLQPNQHYDALIGLRTVGTDSRQSVEDFCSQNAHQLDIGAAKLVKDMDSWYGIESEVTVMSDVIEKDE